MTSGAIIDRDSAPAFASPKTASRIRGASRRSIVTAEGAATVLLPIGLFLGVLALWETVVRFAAIPDAILPPPSGVGRELLRHLGLIVKHAVPTTLETLLAFAIAVPLGALSALVMTWSVPIRKAIQPNVVVFQLIPKIALAPLFITWLGIGTPSRVTFALFISFFPILVSTAAGLQSVPRDTLRLCRSVGASDWRIAWHVRLPMALPYLFSGMKVAVTLAIIGVVVGEFIASQAGLGYLILFATSRQQMDLALACIAVLCVVGLLQYGTIAAVERAVGWRFGDL